MKVFLALLFLGTCVGGVFSTGGGEELEYMARMVKRTYEVQSTPETKEFFEERVKASQRTVELPTPVFECDVATSNQVPTSVHQLRPADINVVMAIGDSVTAGFGLGARNTAEVFVWQNRGESWTVGGDGSLEEDIITIPNILRKFNPNIKGASSCQSRQVNLRYSWLNVAIGGAVSRGMETQADMLIERLEQDERIDMQNDWKLLSLFIGTNDLCRVCHPLNGIEPKEYREGIEKALDKIHAAVPRTFVNLIAMLDISLLRNFSTGEQCDSLQAFECPCAYNETIAPGLRDIQLEYYYQLKNLTDSGKYDVRDDFTVVLQPHMRDVTPPADPATGQIDKAFLSYDCFHPSRKAHRAFAYLLWNTMFTPVGQKPTDSDFLEVTPKYVCPTEENPYIFTKLNSPPSK